MNVPSGGAAAGGSSKTKSLGGAKLPLKRTINTTIYLVLCARGAKGGVAPASKREIDPASYGDVGFIFQVALNLCRRLSISACPDWSEFPAVHRQAGIFGILKRPQGVITPDLILHHYY